MNRHDDTIREPPAQHEAFEEMALQKLRAMQLPVAVAILNQSWFFSFGRLWHINKGWIIEQGGIQQTHIGAWPSRQRASANELLEYMALHRSYALSVMIAWRFSMA